MILLVGGLSFSTEQVCVLTTASAVNSSTCVDDSLALIAVLTETVVGSLACPYYGHVPVLFAQDGKVCSWNKDEAQVLMASVIVRTPRRLSTNPALAISITLSCPYEKTMALGGVATGSMNANDAESVQGSMT